MTVCLSPQPTFLAATLKDHQNLRTLPSIAGSIDIPTGTALAQLHSLASTTSEVESTHQWTANARISPGISIYEIKVVATNEIDSEAFKAISELVTVWWDREGEKVTSLQESFSSSELPNWTHGYGSYYSTNSGKKREKLVVLPGDEQSKNCISFWSVCFSEPF